VVINILNFKNMGKRYSIAIIGAGALGAALAKVLGRNPATTVGLWDIDPSKMAKPASLKDVCAKADFAFLAVPSQRVRSVFEALSPCIKANMPVISFAKGIEIKTKKTMSEVLEEILGEGRPWAILGGPMLSKEIGEGLPAAAVFASPEANIFNKTGQFKELKEIFKPTNLRLEYSTDAQGVALGGVLKNIYAIALGIAEALGMGANALGLITVRAIEEMKIVTKALGGRGETVLTYAGLGDLIATGFSDYSRNRNAGKELVQKGFCSTEPEGCVSIKPLIERLKEENAVVPPLLNAVFSAIEDPKKTKEVFKI
jgi:glycerol-3-phosphate dehydrogenase (NAD(P)+)